ncbi:MAG: hypothetical protein JSR58_02515 [Verrucomicrobia bacterium]|nr:hypothetical protein [Verrucomicrobiota bacterium]
MHRSFKAVLLSALLTSSSAFSMFTFTISKTKPEPEVAATNITPEQIQSLEDQLEQQKKDISDRPNGKFYAGGTVGYGRIVAGDDSLLTSSLFEPLLSVISNTKTKQGGLAYRYFAGCLYNITDHFSMGAEGGFSMYPPTKGTVNIGGLSSSLISEGGFGGFVKSFGYGTDILVNITMYAIPELYFSFKPGIQFAHQKNKVFLDLSALLGSVTFLNSGIFRDTFRNTSLLPEVVLSTGWNFIINRFAFFIQFDYQHVFGSDDAPVTSRVSSRDLIGGSFGFSF